MQCLCVHTFVQSSIPTPLGGIEPPAFRYNTILFKDKLPNRWMGRFSYKEREKSESRMPSTSQTPFIRSVGMVDISDSMVSCIETIADAMNKRSHSVAVITSALHAEGPQFDPG
ncbi:hypothetical protein OUZ56_023556 [Daphnia magna]|uniref:Uncharacterized protein n=1 Tax=Daphnia magna TaxID=35525 RepID=A0ABR0AZ87_9CRUS|nr:hypothetical protein OUZ56_023556 [Daphnia magna]